MELDAVMYRIIKQDKDKKFEYTDNFHLIDNGDELVLDIDLLERFLEYNFYTLEEFYNKHKFKFNEDLTVSIYGYFLERIVSIRKPANLKFYEDDMWNFGYIQDKETLKEHFELYFKENDRFEEEILDKFENGNNIVLYC